jgi:hypothetical protein
MDIHENPGALEDGRSPVENDVVHLGDKRLDVPTGTDTQELIGLLESMWSAIIQ